MFASFSQGPKVAKLYLLGWFFVENSAQLGLYFLTQFFQLELLALFKFFYFKHSFLENSL